MADNNIEDQLNELKKSLNSAKDGLKSGRKFIPLILIVILGFSSFVQIETEEVGVVTRFGKFQDILEPGLKFKIPFIDKVDRVPIERQLKEVFGFEADREETRNRSSLDYYKTRSVAKNTVESQMLTGDLNLADVQWVVQYRIIDPYKYLFKARNPQSTLRDISEASMREIVGDRTVNEVITIGRAEIAREHTRQLQELCDEYLLGLEIDQVVLQNVFPPEEVMAAYNAVNEADQEKETLIDQAYAARNKVIPKAKGQAEETIQKAEGYATERINNAKGEVSRFDAIYNEFIKAPEVTKTRIYLEIMEEVIPKLGDKIIIDEKSNNVLPLLNLQSKSN